MLITLKTDENDLVIIQIYMPTSGYKDEEVEEVYEQLEEIMDTAKKNDNLIILGDWNAVVGEGQEGHVVGKCGLGLRNNKGQRLTDFYKEKELIITDNFFQQHPRRRYTWVKPGNTTRYQIYCIMVKKNHKIHVKQSKTYSAADICSDHNVVAMKYKLQLKKKMYKPALKTPRWAVSKLKDEEEIENYNNRIKQNLSYTETTDTNQQWANLKYAITTAAKETLGKLQQQPRKPWISEKKTIILIEQRRKHKHDKNKREYNRIRNLINRQVKKDKEEWLGQYCEETENQLNGGNAEKSYNLIRKFFGKPKLKHAIT